MSAAGISRRGRCRRRRSWGSLICRGRCKSSPPTKNLPKSRQQRAVKSPLCGYDIDVTIENTSKSPRCQHHLSSPSCRSSPCAACCTPRRICRMRSTRMRLESCGSFCGESIRMSVSRRFWLSVWDGILRRKTWRGVSAIFLSFVERGMEGKI